MPQIAIMFGGDLPGTPEAFRAALEKLSSAGVDGIRASRIVQSAAEECVPGTPDFLDMAVTGQWNGTAEELLALCQRMEREAGRPEIHSSRESRILDCDIILFGEEAIHSPRLTVPHPRARERRFVLEPLSEIAPAMRFPDGATVAGALAALGDIQ